MTEEHLISLLEFCLKTTYFQFQGRFFEQLQGAAIGSPITPIVAKLYMEEFEIRAINTAEHPPRIWMGYVDDIFVVIKTSYKEKFLKHLNSLDSHIQFTTEATREDRSIPFLDTLMMLHPDNSLITTVYRKPTHTDLYLQWNSHQNMAVKFHVINTLTHRAKTVCSNIQLLKEEEDHLKQALKCKYPLWALK